MIRYLFVPEVEPGRGSGHLVRCLELSRLLPASAFLIPAARQDELRRRYPQLADSRLFATLPRFATLPGGELPLVIFDRMQLDEAMVREVLPVAIPVAIDARGKGLRLVPLVVDLLPRLTSHTAWDAANRNAPEFLPQPEHRRPAAAGPLPANAKVLVSFGGEDAAGLGARLAARGHLARLLPKAEVSLLSGPLAERPAGLPAGWRPLEPVPCLREELHRYDLVITSFGLTAHEARSAGCRVLLCNPTTYHQRLAERAGFVSALKGVGTLAAFRKALARLEYLTADAPAINLTVKTGLPGLATWLQALPKTTPCACPGCRSIGNPVIARFPDQTYFSCQDCGLDYLHSFSIDATSYDESYFFTDYQKQYGKTYLDDFEHIKAMGQSRLDCLERLAGGRSLAAGLSRHRAQGASPNPRLPPAAGPSGPAESPLAGRRLLDVGCAYGPFLAAAAECGITACGTDISPGAVAHVHASLGFPAVAGDIRTLGVAELGGPFDIVSLWYVIEHFPDLDRVLARLSELLVPGGWLAMATPSGEGISARRDQIAFLRNSPADHFTIWNPSRVARLLSRYGLELRHVRVTGHHPERFPGVLGYRALGSLSAALSRRFGLGDTFELYAVKTADHHSEQN